MKWQEHYEGEFSQLQPWLPKPLNSVLDIGCGPADVDCWLADMYPECVFHLMDGDGKAPPRSGFRDSMLAWNNVNAAADRVSEFTRSYVLPWKASPNITVSADLVISLLSWGFHYPVETYLPMVVRSLTEHGRIIMDIRNKTDGMDIMQHHFKLLAILDETRKYKRTVWGDAESGLLVPDGTDVA